MLNAFEKASKDLKSPRPTMEAPVYIVVDLKSVGFGIALILLGTIVRVLTNTYNNNDDVLYEQECPALRGRIYGWTRNLGTMFIVYGVICFAIAGIVPKLFLLCQLRDEAICCGQIFMGAFGKVVQVVLLVVLIMFNIYGTVVLVQASQDNVQSQDRWPTDKANTFCNTILLTLSRVLNVAIYLLAATLIGFIAQYCFRSCKYEKDYKPGRYGPEEENVAKVLGVWEPPKPKKTASQMAAEEKRKKRRANVMKLSDVKIGKKKRKRRLSEASNASSQVENRKEERKKKKHRH